MNIPVTDYSEFYRWLDANRAEAARIMGPIMRIATPEEAGLDAAWRKTVADLRAEISRLEDRVRALEWGGND